MVLYSDTHPEIERLQIEGLRRMPTWRKIELVGDMKRLYGHWPLLGCASAIPTILQRSAAGDWVT